MRRLSPFRRCTPSSGATCSMAGAVPTDPGGNGTEAIMRRLDVPGYSERFDREHYRRELDSRPPALVVSPLEGESAYEPLQWTVLREYLTAHQKSYACSTRP